MLNSEDTHFKYYIELDGSSDLLELQRDFPQAYNAYITDRLVYNRDYMYLDKVDNELVWVIIDREDGEPFVRLWDNLSQEWVSESDV